VGICCALKSGDFLVELVASLFFRIQRRDGFLEPFLHSLQCSRMHGTPRSKSIEPLTAQAPSCLAVVDFASDPCICVVKSTLHGCLDGVEVVLELCLRIVRGWIEMNCTALQSLEE